MPMELLGKILHFSKSGRLIVKIDRYNSSMKIGKNVTDEEGKRLGKITELLGPVISPYASIIPFVQKRNRLVGAKVYLDENLRKSHRTSINNSKIKRNKK
ncbi:MAG: H/ACA ribonucleoprotein complex subunit GAR1 [Candidatus Nitrosocosmicus sp.]